MRARWLILTVVVAPGCDDGTGLVGQASVTDSAGVRIVTYATGLPEDLPTWTLGAEPAVVLGNESIPEQQFFETKGARRLSDRSIAVMDGSQQVRVFDRTGRLDLALGGEGEGPGEFKEVDVFGVLPGDSILVFQRIPFRSALFDPSGQVARSASPQVSTDAPFFYLNPFGFLSAASLGVFVYPNYFRIPFEEGLNRPSYPIGVVDLWSREVREVGTAVGLEQMVMRVDRGIRQSFLPFGRSPDFTARADRIYVAVVDGFGVEVWDSFGQAVLRIAVESERRPVNAADLDRYVSRLLAPFEEAGPDQLQEWEEELRAFPIPSTMPDVRRIEVDAEGNIWVEQFAPAGEGPPLFYVFGADGIAIAKVELPQGLSRSTTPLADPWMEIGSDYILGVWVGELGVESVREYDLRKTS